LKNPKINRRLGSEYLSAMLHRYHGDADLAPVAYNAGPARADTAAKDERPLNRFIELNPKTAQETLPYIKRVLGNV
jgi:soluble lytic murein transglycosylase-like protein